MFACLLIPDFAVQASLILEPREVRTALKQSPLAVLDGPASLPRVFATNQAARRAGIKTGMTKLQVETYGGILLRKRSIAVEDTAQLGLLSYAGTFSPRVESTCPGAVIVDLVGTEKLFGSLRSTAHAMTTKAVAIGFDLRVSIASNPDSAFLGVRGFSGNTIIPSGEEAQKLAPLLVRILPISPEILEVLDGWGIRTFQSLAALPTVAIVERLGQDGLHLQKLARGQIERPLLTVEANTKFIESFEFDDPVETLESIFFILNRLLQQVCSNLISVSLAAIELRLTVGMKIKQIQNGQEEEQYQHEWKLPVPTQERNLLFGLVRLHLEKTTFSAPIKKLSVEVVAVKPRVSQGNLFAPPSPEGEKLQLTLERIRGVVGSNDVDGISCVGSPRLVDTHRPGSFTVQEFYSLNESVSSTNKVVPIIAFRPFRPALATSVELDGEKPHFVSLWQRRYRVLDASGPWSSSGNWWNTSAWTREEWDVAVKISDGIGFYRIFRDRILRQWFVEGVFD